MQTVDILKSTNTEKALNVVKSKINRNRRENIFLKFQKASAIVIIPLMLVLSYFIYNYFLDSKTVQYVEMKTYPSQIASFNLPDGSKVWLNSNSKIKYPLLFSEKRIVELEGEAFFDVEKDKKKKFIVKTKGGLSVEVLGTKFNIEAYDNENITTTLIEGKVEVQFNRNNEKVFMLPLQKLTYNINNQKHVLISTASALPDIAWKDGKIIFENTFLADALNILKKRFDVDFVVEDKSLYDNCFTGKFSNESLDVIIKHISISSKIKFRSTLTNNKTTFYLYGINNYN